MKEKLLIIGRIFQARHFWRQASLDEIADLYAAQAIRATAIGLISGFSSVFLYKEGYSLAFIMSFWAIYFLAKVLVNPLAGVVLARFGSAVSMTISNILYIPAIISLSLVPEIGTLGIFLYGLFMCFQATLHETSYYVDFSRVKNTKYAGREIAFMNILEKTVITISPIIGGFIALKFGVQMTMWLAGFMLLVAGVPLFRLNKKVENKHRLVWQGFPWRLVIPSLLAQSSIGFGTIVSSIVWGLFVAIILLPLAGEGIYATLGLLSSVTMVVTIITSSAFGKLIDSRKGDSLMRFGVLIAICVHIFRAFVQSVAGVIGVNISHEVASTAVGMSFMRGIFDIADSSGYRISYIVVLQIAKNIGAAVACLVMVLLIQLYGAESSFSYFYIITALVTSIILFGRFKAYQS